LAHAYQITGDKKYLRHYERLHQQYLYDPDWYLSDDFVMPGIPTHTDPKDRYINIHIAMRWGAGVGWLALNAPNRVYYNNLLEEFIAWNDRILNNSLPTGLSFDYDNMVPTTKRYPEEWIGEKVVQTGEKGINGMDCFSVLDKARMVPHRKVREQSYFAMIAPNKVDTRPLVKVLGCCTSPDHFTSWHDPDDKICPVRLQLRSYPLQAQFVTSWLAAYWRMKKSGEL